MGFYMGITEMMAALTKPKKASFPVAYEIFASTSRKEIAYLENKIETYKAMSPFAFVYKPEKHSLEDAELRKRQTIESFQEKAPKPEELLDSLKDDLNTHIQLKMYFEAEIKRLGLDSPLIFFDDDALRIDIG